MYQAAARVKAGGKRKVTLMKLNVHFRDYRNYITKIDTRD